MDLGPLIPFAILYGILSLLGRAGKKRQGAPRQGPPRERVPGKPETLEDLLAEMRGQLDRARTMEESVELAADLVERVDPRAPEAQRLRELLATARLHSPLFTLRGGTNEVLRGVVARGMGVR